MKMYVYLTIAVRAAIVAVVTECGLMKEHSTEIHRSIVSALQKAYGSDGAEKVSSRIDSLVAKGKLPTVQAEKLKEALLKGYDSLQSKLAELSVRESPRRTQGGI